MMKIYRPCCFWPKKGHASRSNRCVLGYVVDDIVSSLIQKNAAVWSWLERSVFKRILPLSTMKEIIFLLAAGRDSARYYFQGNCADCQDSISKIPFRNSDRAIQYFTARCFLHTYNSTTRPAELNLCGGCFTVLVLR